MKYYTTIFLLIFFCGQYGYAQNVKEMAYEKAMEAIALMDEGKFDESIVLLEECQKMDEENINYPYEIALANVYKKDYQQAIKVLKKLSKNKNVNDQVYQLLGNTYSMSGDAKKAIKTYKSGIQKFPNAGNLYLETGNIYAFDEDYDQAILNYEKGIEVDPMYPSNYFRLSELYLSSTDKLSGLIYGEIFMNLERTTERTQAMSEMLFAAYKNSVEYADNEIGFNICSQAMVVEASAILNDEWNLPLCLIFEKNFLVALIETKEINLSSLSSIRSRFLDYFLEEDQSIYQNVLFDYHKEMKDLGIFDSYNHYLFQIAVPDEFDNWHSGNQKEFDQFVDWYVNPENEMQITTQNRYKRD